jgi:hypothetical protein
LTVRGLPPAPVYRNSTTSIKSQVSAATLRQIVSGTFPALRPKLSQALPIYSASVICIRYSRHATTQS